MNKKNNFVIPLVIVVIVSFVIGSVIFIYNQNNSKSPETKSATGNHFYYIQQIYSHGSDNEISYTALEEKIIDRNKCENIKNQPTTKTVFVVKGTYGNYIKERTIGAKTSLVIDEEIVEHRSGYNVTISPQSSVETEFTIKASGCHEKANIIIYDINTGEEIKKIDINNEMLLNIY